MNKLPWEWLQSFVVVAKHGSLSKAALELQTSQPTLSRQMAGLERQLGISLFDRSTQGLKITDVGAKLIDSSDLMLKAALQFERIASGQSESLIGSIRISANEVIGLYYLPAIIARFNRQYPELEVEIDISNSATSINKRDTDIALRMFRPTQPDLIAKRLKDIELFFTASKEYLAQYGAPTSLEQAKKHMLIGFDRDIAMLKAATNSGWQITPSDFTNRTDSLAMQIELARYGAGISVTHRPIIEQYQELQIILSEVPIPNLEFWLVCHADVQYNRKIRVMMDFLSESLDEKTLCKMP
jgi:DNA-binding transcriptional LysR family regulator